MRFCAAVLALSAVSARLHTSCQQIRVDDPLQLFPSAAEGGGCGEALQQCAAGRPCVKLCRQNAANVVVKSLQMDSPPAIEAAQRESNAMLAINGVPGTMQMLRCVELKTSTIFVFEALYKDLNVAREEFRGLSPDRQAGLFIEAATTLRDLHQRNWTHGDIKPENIMLTGKDLQHVKLIDFGYGAENGRDFAGGTFYFMPPEISLNDYRAVQTTAMDVWMLGATMLDMVDPELLSFMQPMAEMPGAFSYRGPIHHVLSQRIADLLTPANEDLGPRLMRWMAYDAAQRATMQEVVEDLQRWGGRLFALGPKGPNGKAVLPKPDPPGVVPWRRKRIIDLFFGSLTKSSKPSSAPATPPAAPAAQNPVPVSRPSKRSKLTSWLFK